MRAIMVALVISIMVVTMIVVMIAIVIIASTIIRDRKTAAASVWVIVMVIIVSMWILGLWDIYGDLAGPHRMIGVCNGHRDLSRCAFIVCACRDRLKTTPVKHRFGAINLFRIYIVLRAT